MSVKRSSIVALLLLIPAPSIGVIFGMILLPDQITGKVLFFCAKAWLLLLPLVWLRFVDRAPLSLSKPTHGGFGVAAALGLAISVFIGLAYFTLGKRLIDPQAIKDMASQTGLNSPLVYLVGSIYWITLNSVLEEYVWRWFVVEKFSQLMGANRAIVASALGFTLHHVIALQIFLSVPLCALCALGIFIGGATWSWCYIRYRSIWPGYLSHAIVDLAIFSLGYLLIFH
jgi:membrane protease YdiL (CAAX protease family)